MHLVVGFCTGKLSKAKAFTEFDALHCGHGKKNLAEAAFDGVKIGCAQACRQIDSHQLDDTAHAVQNALGSEDAVLHLLADVIVDNWKGLGIDGL